MLILVKIPNVIDFEIIEPECRRGWSIYMRIKV